MIRFTDPKGGGVVMDDIKLKRCPCGQMPGKVFIRDAGQGGKWGIVSGDCCGEWDIEFRTDYNDLESEECQALAIDAWNDAPRY